MINESLRNRDKKNKEKIYLMINEENKYKNKYLQKIALNKNLENYKSLGNKKPLKNKDYYKMNKYYKPKSQSIANFSKIDYSNKIHMPLGPYSNILNGNGGFCTKIFNNKNNASQFDISRQLYSHYLNKFIYNKNKNQYQNINYKNKYRTNNINKKTNNFLKTNYNLKVNIHAVNRNIKFFKLNTKIKNLNKVKSIDNLNKNKIKINKRYSYNKEEDRNKIYQNERFYYHRTPIKYMKEKDKLILIKQTNDVFSMNSYRAKTFSDLFQIDNIVLNFSPSASNTNRKRNSKNYLTNCSICSSQQEFSIIKEKKKRYKR